MCNEAAVGEFQLSAVVNSLPQLLPNLQTGSVEDASQGPQAHCDSASHFGTSRAPAIKTMEIHRVQPSELSAAFSLLAENGWCHRVCSLEEFTALVDASQIADVAIDNGQVVGFVRGITDGLSNGYLSMVVVEPDYQGQGIGTQLVEHAMGTNPAVTWVLRAGREGAADFFAKLGFEASSLAMERRRT